MTNNSSRFIITTKKLMIEQKKTLLYLIGGFLGICLVIGLWLGLLFGGSPGEGPFIFYLIFAGFACALVASKMGFDLTSKEGRTSMLMTPASPAEKFIPRLIAVLPGMMILVVIGYILLNYTMILSCGIAYGFWAPFFNPFGQVSDSEDWLVIWTLFSAFIFNEGMFIFGSVAWPRKSFLKTIGIFVALQILLSCAMIFLAKSNIRLAIENGEPLIWTISSVTLLGIGLIWWSYLRFKKISVI